MLYSLLGLVKLYAVITSAISKCSVLSVLTSKLVAYILLYDMVCLILLLTSWYGKSGVRVGGGVMAGGVFR